MNKLKENTVTHRKCSKCKELKSLNNDNFNLEKTRLHGFSYNCKECEKKRSKIKYNKNPRLGRYKLLTTEQKNNRLLTANKYYKTEKGRAIMLVSAYRKIDKLKDGKSNISQTFLINNIFNKECIYCGDTNNLGCDRIDNSLFHTEENVVPCCKECNIARMDNFTVEEMKLIGVAIKQVKLNRVKELENLYT